MAAGIEILNRAGIPTFQFPDTAARAFIYMWRYSYNLRGLVRDAACCAPDAEEGPDRARAEGHREGVRESGPHAADRARVEAAAGGYGIPTVETRSRTTRTKPRQGADELGYPVVLKLHSRHHHAQDRRRRRAVEPERRRRGARAPGARLKRRCGKGRRRPFSGRHGAADVRAGGIRTDPRQQHRSAVRSGAAVRSRRPAGRGLQGSRRSRCRR